MTLRDVVKAVLDGHEPPYVPWHCGFTSKAAARLSAALGSSDLDLAIGNHFVKLGRSTGYFEALGGHRFIDPFGVVWNRALEKDIGVVERPPLAQPTLDGYCFPDPLDPMYFEDIPEELAQHSDCFRAYCIGFSLFERAWTLRGMENLLIDMVENPAFVDELLDLICDYNIARVRKALQYDIDAIYYGDDWGQQSGLIMGPRLWRRFIRPRIARMYEVTRQAGRYQLIHSCGDIRSLIDDLIELGVNCINPFQPEAIPVEPTLERYRGRVTFHGGLSTQRVLPHGSPEDVRRETRRLLTLGSKGGLIFAPSHAVIDDTPLENMLAFLGELHK